MIKLQAVFVALLCIISSSVILKSKERSAYYNELKALKQNLDTKIIFDEDAHQGLSAIQRDIDLMSQLSWIERFARKTFLAQDVVMVTPDNMPQLSAYIDSVCQYGHIVTPIVFITRHETFFNAFAQKLLMSTGAVLIGQKLLKECTTQEIEAIVAHEIGHIKHNHVNKMLALKAAELVMYLSLTALAVKNDSILISCCAWIAPSVISALLVNKRFEKEADIFACEVGKGQGLVDFFELLKQKEENRDNEFIQVYDALKTNRSRLPSNIYNGLMIRYYLAKMGHNFTQAYKNVYHNTFLGAHPSPQARIDAAQEYLIQHA